jgi:hypothetical protein
VKDERARQCSNPAKQRATYTPIMNFTKNIGMLLLAIYLILVGINGLTGFIIPAILLAILALVAGIMILIGK